MVVMCTRSFQFKGTMVMAGNTIDVTEEQLKDPFVKRHVGAVDHQEIARHASAGVDFGRVRVVGETKVEKSKVKAERV